MKNDYIMNIVIKKRHRKERIVPISESIKIDPIISAKAVLFDRYLDSLPHSTTVISPNETRQPQEILPTRET